MKKVIFIYFGFLLNTILLAQFTGNLNQANIISNQTSSKTGLKVIEDGNGGYYSFWMDDRSSVNKKEIYGQHSDANGFPLWTVNGKLIVSPTIKNVIDFRCVSVSGGIAITWLMRSNSPGDSLMCKKIDSNGNDVWAQPTLISKNNSTSILGTDVSGFNIFANDSGVTITHSVVFFGGAGGFTFNRVDAAGNLRWPLLQFLPSNLPGYDYRTCSDGQNGFYVLSKGNGIGSGMYINHFNLQGARAWVNSKEVTGNSANGFRGNISMMVDQLQNFYVVWGSAGYDIFASKLTPQGNFAWSINQKRISDTIIMYHSRPYAQLYDNKIYVTWIANQLATIPNVMMQKMDTAGNGNWGSNGLIVSAASPATNPSFARSDSNALMLAYRTSTTNTDMNVQRIRTDGSLTWSGSGKPINIGQALNNVPAIVIDDTTGCNAIFWETSSSANTI